LNGNIELMRDLTATGRLVDLSPYLQEDPAWADSFVDRTFEYYTQDDGAIYGIPYNRDYIGIYYNQGLLDQAEVDGNPAEWSWDEFFSACEQLNAAGILPFAMDGEWVTLLMWANMVGTQPGGAEWLASQDADRQFAGVEPVVAGTEMLRDYHAQGCVNEDAFTRDYSTAATLFLQGEAAFIANGPWMINQITGEVAETVEGLADHVGYATSPGGGSIFIIGESAFAVGANEPEKIQAAVEFVKFVTSPEQVANQLRILGTGSSVDTELPDDAPPLLASITEQGEQADVLYPHAFHALDTAVVREWVNQWPDYVRGGISTDEFLGRLDEVQASQ
jgi:ABC-type glycerol-3-phosphate transport system substrate-binding protein